MLMEIRQMGFCCYGSKESKRKGEHWMTIVYLWQFGFKSDFRIVEDTNTIAFSF